MGASNWVDIEVELIKKMTDKAMLCVIGDEEVWLPFSQVAHDEDYEEGDENLTLSITEWIAEQKGL
jgi:hypothetical protein